MTAMFRLARWLGPWTSSDVVPRSVDVSELTIDETQDIIHVKVYRPAKQSIRGIYMVSQGLHFLGPDDPRMDRFCRVLADAGFEVFAPRLPSYMNMRLKEDVIREFKCVFGRLEEFASVRSKPALFSISFGALPVLRLASDPDVRDRISSVVTFGAYIDWMTALYYTIEGRIHTEKGSFESEPDPLNQPAIFMNFLEGMGLDSTDAARLHEAWFQYLRITWGRDECRERAVHEPIALEIAASFDEPLQELFILGCGLGDQCEALRLCLEADKRCPELGGALDVRSHLSGIRVPVHLFHGLDDDVFPYTQMEELQNAFPATANVQTYLTGLYGHTGTQGAPKGGLLRELRTMLRMLHVLANAPGRVST